jgi:predicted O-methyltransferase YrrM
MKFDLVFWCADKENYINYFNIILPKMNKGGIILSDNVLSGKVLEPLHPKRKAKYYWVQRFTEKTWGRNRLLPIRDGLTVSRVI